MRYPLLLAFAVALGGVACDSTRPPTVCTAELRSVFTPAETTLTKGQQFKASVALSTCGGAQPLLDTFNWKTEDSTVATVDGATGIVTAIGTGKTELVALGKQWGTFAGGTVTVR